MSVCVFVHVGDVEGSGFFVVLHAVEVLVEQREHHEELRDRLRRTEAEAEILKTRAHQCKCSR